MQRRLRVLLFIALAGCGGGGGSGTAPSVPFLPPPPPAKAGKYFTHIVVMIQENRTFDNLFARFPGADGTRSGKLHNGKTYFLRQAALVENVSPNNGYIYWLRDWHRGKMDGFDTVPIHRIPGIYVYQYVDPEQIAPYWTLAKRYVLADHLFQTEGSGSFTAHQDLIRGGTAISATQHLMDFPTALPWGCDAPAGTRTSLIGENNDYRSGAGPFPCLSYATLRDRLDAKQLSWRYYTPATGVGLGGNYWNAFDAIDAVRHGPEWGANVVSPEKEVLRDIARNSLPAVSWVIPDAQNSDHPGTTSDAGPSWVAQVVNAIGASPSWKNTAIVIVWDDWGGWYDHVAPPKPHRFGGLGFRVPMLLVSPYSRAGYVSHKTYEFGSIVKFIEENWNLPPLGTTDVRAADFVADFFDFSRARGFVPVGTKYSESFFLQQPPSNRPVDDDQK
ncbi:MAG: hypothetical protein JO030_03315 [Candidatus Eremiobacteraeota bacterium]|nr:hypothetical protein [Candidatus Eremiobacteraeota bacterium]